MTTAWRPATCVDTRAETPTARSIRLKVDDLGPVVPGQHVDVRLTADDGYQAVRSYSLSATPVGGPGGSPLAIDEVEIAVEELPDGEVSPYLVSGLEIGDALEVRGPIGGWFVWHDAETAPVQLIGGGSGVAPLVAMLRARVAGSSTAPMRLLYSVRSPEAVYFGEELQGLAETSGVSVDLAYTRVAPEGCLRAPGRITDDDVRMHVQAPGVGTIYVCGPNWFVTVITDLLLEQGHDPASIRTERFGGV